MWNDKMSDLAITHSSQDNGEAKTINLHQQTAFCAQPNDYLHIPNKLYMIQHTKIRNNKKMPYVIFKTVIKLIFKKNYHKQ